MKTKAVRLYGKGDLRLEEFELPQIEGKRWYRVADTGKKDDFLLNPLPVKSKTYSVKERSSVIFISNFSD